MIVEVLGIHEHNKGAMLMLEAIRERLAADVPEAQLAINVHMSRKVRQALNLTGVVTDEGGGIRTRLVRALPKALRRRLKLATADEVDAILDASGFSYGDYWGTRNLENRLVRRLRRWRKPGKVAIMLPQALGPFTSPEARNLFAEAVEGLDQVFVRDRQSLAHVSAVASSPHISLSPDFTGLLHPALEPQHEDLAGAGFIIPNEKVVTGRDPAARVAYLDFLALAVDKALGAGNRIHILVHEGEKDARIARDLNERLSAPLKIVDLHSTLQTKALIGCAKFVIGSRFHGIVSALTAGVPPLVIGWSHKYEELLADYGLPDAIADLDAPDTWQQKIETLLRVSEDQDFRARLMSVANEQRASSDAMWKLVSEKLRARV
jgi:polysaccharide pyruvyl transferase WcaK-like protein